MTPVWMCPVRLRDATRSWTLYPMRPGRAVRQLRLLGHGAAARRARRDGYYNRMVEEEVGDARRAQVAVLHGVLRREEFRRRYNGAAYDKLKADVRRRTAGCSTSTTSPCAAGSIDSGSGIEAA